MDNTRFLQQWCRSKPSDPYIKPLTIQQTLSSENEDVVASYHHQLESIPFNLSESSCLTTIVNGKPHIREPFGLASDLEIRELKGKGRGLFAKCDISAGSIIFIDKPIFTFPELAQPTEEDIHVVFSDLIDKYNTHMSYEIPQEDQYSHDEDDDQDATTTAQQNDESSFIPQASFLSPYGQYYSQQIICKPLCSFCNFSLLSTEQEAALVRSRLQASGLIFDQIFPDDDDNNNPALLSSPITIYGIPLKRLLHAVKIVEDQYHQTHSTTHLPQSGEPQPIDCIDDDIKEIYTAEAYTPGFILRHFSPLCRSWYFADLFTFSTQHPPLFCSMHCLDQFLYQFSAMFPMWVDSRARLETQLEKFHKSHKVQGVGVSQASSHPIARGETHPTEEASPEQPLQSRVSNRDNYHHPLVCVPVNDLISLLTMELHDLEEHGHASLSSHADAVTMLTITLVANQWTTGLRVTMLYISLISRLYHSVMPRCYQHHQQVEKRSHPTLTTTDSHVDDYNDQDPVDISTDYPWWDHITPCDWESILQPISSFDRVDYASMSDENAELSMCLHAVLCPVIDGIWSLSHVARGDVADNDGDGDGDDDEREHQIEPHCLTASDVLCPSDLLFHIISIVAFNSHSISSLSTLTRTANRKCQQQQQQQQGDAQGQVDNIIADNLHAIDQLSGNDILAAYPIRTGLFPNHALLNHACRNNAMVWSCFAQPLLLADMISKSLNTITTTSHDDDEMQRSPNGTIVLDDLSDDRNEQLQTVIQIPPTLSSAIFIVALYDLKEGDEITISYAADHAVDHLEYYKYIQEQILSKPTIKPPTKSRTKGPTKPPATAVPEAQSMPAVLLSQLKVPKHVHDIELSLSRTIYQRFGWKCACETCTQRVSGIIQGKSKGKGAKQTPLSARRR